MTIMANCSGPCSGFGYAFHSVDGKCPVGGAPAPKFDDDEIARGEDRAKERGTKECQERSGEKNCYCVGGKFTHGTPTCEQEMENERFVCVWSMRIDYTGKCAGMY